MFTKPKLPADKDQILIARICANDKKALSDLYERYVNRLLGLANQILLSKDDAQDVIHDVIIEVWKKAKDYDPNRASVLGWLLLRVRSRCLDRIRKQQTIVKYLENQKKEPEKQAKSVSDAYSENRQLDIALKVLTINQRQVVELNYFKGLTCAEIAQDYAIPLGTVKTRLLTAMKKMQQNNSKLGGNHYE